MGVETFSFLFSRSVPGAHEGVASYYLSQMGSFLHPGDLVDQFFLKVGSVLGGLFNSGNPKSLGPKYPLREAVCKVVKEADSWSHTTCIQSLVLLLMAGVPSA